MLPTSEGIAPEFIHVPYYGQGVSNQISRNSPTNPLGPGVQATNPSLYVPKLSESVTALEEQIDALANAMFITFDPVGSTPNNAGASSVGLSATLQPADQTHPGVITAGAQSFGGQKTFTDLSATGDIFLTGINAPAGGTERTVVVDSVTGKIGSQAGSGGGISSLAAVGAIPNSAAASIVGTVLNLQPANSTNPGVITATGQTLGGQKTFIDSVTAAGLTSTSIISLPLTSGGGIIQQPAGTTLFHTGSGSGYGIYIGKDGASTSAPINNVAVGYQALKAVSTGNNNVCVGRQSGTLMGTGLYNVMIGDAAGSSVSSGSGNVLVGRFAGGSTSGTLNGCVMVGSMFGVTVPSGTSNAVVLGGDGVSGIATGTMILGNSSTSNTVITGISGTTVAADQMVVMNAASKQLGTVEYLSTSVNFTPTIDAGTISSSLVRGSGGTVVPIQLSKQGKTINMLIPSFMVTAQTMAAGTITFTGVSALPAAYRPQYPTSFRVSANDGGAFVDGYLSISVGGIVVLQIAGAAFFTLPSGILYDIGVSWITA